MHRFSGGFFRTWPFWGCWVRWHISTYACMLYLHYAQQAFGVEFCNNRRNAHLTCIRCVVAALRRCIVASLRRCIFASLRLCVLASLRGCCAAWLLRCVVASSRRCIVASLHRCGVASLRRWALAALMPLGRSFAKNLRRQHSYGSCTDTDAVEYQALLREALPKTSAAA